MAVVGFNAVMSVEEVAITAEHTTAVGGLILDAVVGGAFHKATERMHGHCVLSRFFRLRKSRQRHRGYASNYSDNEFLYKHFHSSFSVSVEDLGSVSVIAPKRPLPALLTSTEAAGRRR